MQQRALVLFSGGQDSTTCLAWALERFEQVQTIGFDYGQRHSVELTCRERILQLLPQHFPHWHDRLGPDHVIDLQLLGQISDTAMTSKQQIRLQENGLPNTFVPGRNLLFFTFAAAIAYRQELGVLVGGMCETDYSGYPDCRDNTLKSLQVTLSLGMDMPLVIATPLMWLTKQQSWELAEQLAGQALVDFIVEYTHSCYVGDREHRHPWGYGCGQCPACALRRQGYDAYMANKGR